MKPAYMCPRADGFYRRKPVEGLAMRFDGTPPERSGNNAHFDSQEAVSIPPSGGEREEPVST
jgi:hypothetical protein